MNRSLARTLLPIAAAATVLAPLPLRAGALSPYRVSADAKWLVHLDVERFAASRTCQVLNRDPEHGKAFQATLLRYRDLFGTDPLTAVSEITLYGEDVAGSRGVALINGDLNAKTVVQRLAGYPRYRTKTAAGLTLHKWADKSTGLELTACFFSARLLAIASDESALLAAVQVLRAQKPSLKSAPRTSLPLPPPDRSVFFLMVTRGYAGSTEAPLNAMILRNTDSAVMQVAEQKGILDANLSMAAASPDAAVQIQMILNGLIVSASLAPDDSGLADLAGKSTIDRAGQTITLRLTCPAQEAAPLLAGAILSR